MNKGNEVSLHIDNSFDCTMALRVSFDYRGFIFGRIRQVHMGTGAAELITTQSNINSWYTNAIGAIEAMGEMTLNTSDMNEIARIAFKARGINVSNITNFTTRNFDNALDFVMYLVDGIKCDYFMRETPKGTKVVKAVKREALMVTINNKIWNYLKTNNPELYI